MKQSKTVSQPSSSRIKYARAANRYLYMHTSLLVTGFSNKLKCVSLENFPSTSKSASSAKLFDVSIRVVRLGMLLGTRGSIVLIRFLASRSVCSRGERGKFDRAVMSLSVKSIASWSYILYRYTCSAFHIHNHTQYSARIYKGRKEG